MYGMPEHLDLSRFAGATLVQICLGEYQVQFNFQPARAAGSPDMLTVSVEGGWEYRDGSGQIVDRAQAHAEREAYRVHRLLGRAVVGTGLDAPRSFVLRFAGGEELRIFDDSEQYESFSIQPEDIFV